MEVVDCWGNQNIRHGVVWVNLVKVRNDGGCLLDGSSEGKGNTIILFLQADEGVILEEGKESGKATVNFYKKGCESSGFV